MILTNKVMELIEQKCQALPYASNYYPIIGPQESVYPFVCASPIYLIPDFTFSQNINEIRIQFSVYDDDSSPGRVTNILRHLECIFHRNHSLEFIAPRNTEHLICCYKLRESIMYLNKDHYWQGTADYVFVAQRDRSDAT
jgi:hypothetical protein